MLKLAITLAAGGTLLSGCAILSTPPAQQKLAMQAVLRINHSPNQSATSWYQLGRYHQERGEHALARAAYAESSAQGARQRRDALPAKPVPTQAAARTIITQPAARMELVQIAPHMYELKLKLKLKPTPAERPALAAAAPAPAATFKTRPFKVEIANGNGAPGMVMLARQLITLRGIAVSRISNERSYSQQQTQIQYPPGYRRQAQRLKDALKGYAVMVRNDRLPAHADLRLVLGKDAILPMTLPRSFGPALAAN